MLLVQSTILCSYVWHDALVGSPLPPLPPTPLHDLIPRSTFVAAGASVPPGAGCSPASQQAAASVLKQLRRIRRRLATGRLHLVNSAWLTDTLTSAAAEGPGALRRKPELLYTPLVLRQALSSARQASAAAASSDVGPAAGGAGQHGGHEPPATSGVQQSGGVWSWPWELVGLGDTTGSSSDSDGGEQLDTLHPANRHAQGAAAEPNSTTYLNLLSLRPIQPLGGFADQHQDQQGVCPKDSGGVTTSPLE